MTADGSAMTGRHGPPAAATLGGRVTREKDGAPIAGAVIAVNHERLVLDQWDLTVATTQPDGSWSIPIAPGAYRISATAPGFVTKVSDRVIVPKGASPRVALELTPGGHVVRGTVTDVGGGPIVGARVSMWGEVPAIALTNGSGAYALAVGDGFHQVDVDHEDYVPDYGKVGIDGDDGVLDFHLVPGSMIRGDVVTDDTHLPLAGAQISSSSQSEAESGGDGTFALRQLRAGRYQLSARAPGYVTRGEVAVSLGVGEVDPAIHLVAHRALAIHGRLDATPGTVFSEMQIRSWGRMRVDIHAPVASDGSFVLDGLEPAVYAIQVFAKGFAPVDHDTVTVIDRDVNGVVIQLTAGNTVRGRIDPPTAFELRLQDDGSEWRGNVNINTSPTGEFVLRAVPNGTYKLYATTADGSSGTLAVAVRDHDRSDLVVKMSQPPTAAVSGRVIDSDGLAVSGVFVAVDTTIVSTRSDGRFLAHVTPGKHMVAFARDSPRFDNTTPTIEAPRSDLVLTLAPRHSAIRGRVIASNGQPMRDVAVTADGPDSADGKSGEYIPSVLTRADGSFELTPLQAGAYSLRARDGRTGGHAEVKRANTGDAGTIQLPPLSTLTGHVTSNGKPVRIFELTCGVLSQQFDSPDGSYRFTSVELGTTLCKAVTREGEVSGFVDVGTEPAHLDLAIERFASAHGTVVNAITGRPIAGLLAYVEQYEIGETWARGAAVSDDAGRFAIAHVRAGKDYVQLSSSGSRWGRGQVAVEYNAAPGQDVDVGIIRAMPARHGLRGTLGMSCDQHTFAISGFVSDGPAARAGVRVGDIIVTIDGTAVTGLSNSEVLQQFLEGETLTAGDTYRFGFANGAVVAITAVEL